MTAARRACHPVIRGSLVRFLTFGLTMNSMKWIKYETERHFWCDVIHTCCSCRPDHTLTDMSHMWKQQWGLTVMLCVPCEGWCRPRSWHQSHWGHGRGRQELLQDPLHLPQHLVSNPLQTWDQLTCLLGTHYSHVTCKQRWRHVSQSHPFQPSCEGTEWSWCLTDVSLCCRPAVAEQEQLQTQRWPLRSSPPTWSCMPSPQAGCHVWPPPTACSNKCSSGTFITPGQTHTTQRYETGNVWCECVAVCVCRYQGYIGAALVLGGMDCNGPHLYSIYPHGSTDKLPYVTMGQSPTRSSSFSSSSMSSWRIISTHWPSSCSFHSEKNTNFTFMISCVKSDGSKSVVGDLSWGSLGPQGLLDFL